MSTDILQAAQTRPIAAAPFDARAEGQRLMKDW